MYKKIELLEIPKNVLAILETLHSAGYEAYLVGGCVRNLLMDKKPKDWDITTNAKPDQIAGLFAHTFNENDFGTVTVVNDDATDESVKKVEITPYRLEANYSNLRHPDAVTFSDSLEEDLKRRDFTINAIAFDPLKGQIIDLYKGQEDIKDKVVRAVGNPMERLTEDALRIMRGIRLAVELDFEISRETADALQKVAQNIEKIATERIQTEFTRILMSHAPKRGIELLHEVGVLKYIVPELEQGIGCEQNGDHIYHVWEHNLRAVQHSADNEWPFHVRLGALMHDIGKPATRRWDEAKKDYTFYGHDVVGARITKEVCKRLKFSRETSDVVEKLVRHHLFFSDIDKITLSAVRRIVSHMGPENVWDLMKVRACDRIGMGRPKEKPYRLRKYEAMIEEAMRAPVSVAMLKINGQILMDTVHVKPGPAMGWILHALLEEVLDDPSRNTGEYLVSCATALKDLPEAELKTLGEAGKEKKADVEEAEIAEIRKKHWVK
ncbi:MAG TPA: CCA tRNA nucleotidyltransferase [Candidatus Paceibacterota bacterium]